MNIRRDYEYFVNTSIRLIKLLLALLNNSIKHGCDNVHKIVDLFVTNSC